MFSDNIKILFDILSCNNSEIAEAAGCSRSYISHLRNDNRNLKSSGKAVTRLVEGIYRFAEKENLLDSLYILTEVREQDRKVLISALTKWLFEADASQIPPASDMPRREKQKPGSKQQREFGDKLNKVMQLLELSNARLAHTINVDDSLVSRWRNGQRSPGNNRTLSGLLVQTLLRRADNLGREPEIAKLSGISPDLLHDKKGMELFAKWLFGKENVSIVPAMDKLLLSISGLPDTNADTSAISVLQSLPIVKKIRYRNTDGLRQAVIRFLTASAQYGGKLCLYSDESMEWMSGDENFFATWKALMATCIQRGVTIRIIHNIDREMDEMLTAIIGWLPLYMSGQIEPYVCRKPNDPRFTHTLFLNPGSECICGTGIVNSPDKWYDYITDTDRLSILRKEFEALFSFSEPLVKVYAGKDYPSHILSVSNQIANEKELRMLSELPFPDIRILQTESETTVLRSKAPYAAFSFTDPYMLHVFGRYIDSMKQHIITDRDEICSILNEHR